MYNSDSFLLSDTNDMWTLYEVCNKWQDAEVTKSDQPGPHEGHAAQETMGYDMAVMVFIGSTVKQTATHSPPNVPTSIPL